MKKIELIVFAVIAAGSASALSLGQIDTFQDGTTNDWLGGASPTNISTGGPAGSGDRFLQITSTGTTGPGSKLATHNSVQWIGNYASAGVTSVECDLRNFGATDVQMRIVVSTPNFTTYTSKNTINVPAGSGWTHKSFSLKPADLILASGAETAAEALANCSQLMIRHDTVGGAGGTAIAAILGIDNIKAVGGSTVAGTLTLANTTVSSGNISATFEYRTPGTQTIVSSATVSVDRSTGAFSIPAPSTPGTYDLAIKYGHWLRKKVSVNTTGGNVTGVQLELTNGDVDADNVVSVFDYILLSDAFDAMAGDPTWNPDADLDEDGAVSVFDYIILSDHFDESGAE